MLGICLKGFEYCGAEYVGMDRATKRSVNVEPGRERIQLVTDSMKEAGLDAIGCGLPNSVLMLSGYWPVLASCVTAIDADGDQIAIRPEGEEVFVRAGWAGEVQPYSPVTVQKLRDAAAEIGPILRDW